MNRLRLIEERLERIKHVGNLQLQELKSLCHPNAVIAKDNRQGKVVFHLHSVGHEDLLSARRLRLQMRKRMKTDLGSAARSQSYRIPMSVRVGKIAETAEPFVSIVRAAIARSMRPLFSRVLSTRREPDA
jgi:hypothetical protein